MANRYNRYTPVDYVHLPIDAYQAALGSAESDRLQQLATTKQEYDALSGVQASWHPDTELKNDTIAQLQQKVKGIANRNLNGRDSLLELDKIVNDPNTINTLADIAGNTINYNTWQANRAAHLKEYGNDTNLLRMDDDAARYNAQGKEGFQRNFMKDSEPGKFIDIIGDVQDAFSKAKQEGYKKDNVTGNWITEQDHLGLSLPELIKKFNPAFNDPKYARQLENIQYGELRKYGDPSNPRAALGNYNKAQIDNIDASVIDGTAYLNQLITAKKAYKGKHDIYAGPISDTRQRLLELQQQKQGYASDNTGNHFLNDVLERLSATAASPFVREPDNIIKGANPFSLEEMKFRHSKQLFDYKKKQLMPPQVADVQGRTFSGPTSLVSDGLAQKFKTDFADLDIKPISSIGSAQSKADNQLQTVLSGAATNYGVGAYNAKHNDAIVSRQTDPKIFDFTDFVNTMGYSINKDKIIAGDKDEFARLKQVHDVIKANGTSSIAAYTMDLGNTLDPVKLTDYLEKSISSAGGYVTDENGEKVAFTSTMGSASKEDAHAKLFMQLNNNTIPILLNSFSNKVMFTGLDGKNYFTNPDTDLQGVFNEQNKLLLPASNVGKGLGYVSLANGTKEGSTNRELFVPVQGATNMTPAETNEVLKTHFGTTQNFDINKVVPKDGATIYIKDKKGITAIPYSNYMQNKEVTEQQYDMNNAVILERDADGNISAVNVARNPKTRQIIRTGDLTGQIHHHIVSNLFRDMIKAPNKLTQQEMMLLQGQDEQQTQSEHPWEIKLQ